MNWSHVLIIGIIIGLLVRQSKQKGDTYQSLQGKSLDESIDLLREKSHSAKLKVLSFPDFPRIWLVPPEEKGSYDSIGERYCIEFMELLFPRREFKKVRPDWLRNPSSGRCLELDGYCEELSLAIEYDGVQHYQWPNFIGMTKEEFLKQRDRDEIKVKACLERNICLIRIPYTVPLERIPLAIYSRLLDAVRN